MRRSGSVAVACRARCRCWAHAPQIRGAPRVRISAGLVAAVGLWREDDEGPPTYLGREMDLRPGLRRRRPMTAPSQGLVGLPVQVVGTGAVGSTEVWGRLTPPAPTSVAFDPAMIAGL